MIKNCNNYEDETCPKGLSLTTNISINPSVLDILFVGCWGTYCRDGTMDSFKYKKGNFEKSESTYGAKSVVQGMTEYSNTNKVDAIILAGDNIYSRNPNDDEFQNPQKYPNLKESLYDMSKQLQEGFVDCMSKVNTNTFYLAIGNHDITNCDILNKQLNFNQNKWNLPALYYNTIYNMSGYKVNLIFIDTNLYDKVKSCNSKEYPEDSNDRNESHEEWLINAVNKQKKWVTDVIKSNKCEWNLIIGHIPFINNPHKKIKGEGSLDYASNPEMTKDIEYITLDARSIGLNVQLYLCADEHNQQLIKCPKNYESIKGIDNLPAIIIAGSGGTDLDDVLISNTLSKCTKYSLRTHGFVSLKINLNKLYLTFHKSLNMHTEITKSISVDLLGEIEEYV